MNTLYRTFVQVVEHGTLSEAADRLHLTQPSVTRQLQQLERTYGTALFDRAGRKMLLNRAGQRVYQTARQVLALEQRLADELREFANPEIGTVYIAAGLTPSIYLLPPVLAAYRDKHPKVQFQVQSGSSKEVLEMLHTGAVDMGVVTTAESNADLTLTALVLDRLLLVAAPNHPLPSGGAVRFSELSEWPMVLMRPESGLRSIVESIAVSTGTKLQIAMETDSLESINRLVQTGVGLSVLPQSAVADDLAAGRLVEISLGDVELGSRTITLATRTGATLPANAERFAAALPGLCRQSAACYN
ncbi:LysR family transcriptional regulator [Alicyclobacillus sp. ALC3]|uniref:LysR family transcriptional regulator n=1 Tax=Alicyclobacillus sp. ALC3 TaxID=2796143 RepID=UPI0023785D49|nr:LysR family transcriptional regulator [Alicyclobacillus sp. ALC3]WDL95867.1 LysR family transcriptional regulator [Alicyclobacillus sp. ALC3]